MGLFRRLFGVPEAEDDPRAIRVTVTQSERLSVVGESFYQPALLAVTGAAAGEEVRHDCIAELVPEPENPHDPNAVKVMIEGQQVGHLSRSDALLHGPRIQSMLERKQPPICRAFVGCAPDTGNPNLGVVLDVAF